MIIGSTISSAQVLPHWGSSRPMPIRSLALPGAFDPEAIAAMTEAFDVACEKLGDTDQPEVSRKLIAGRIIAAARFGERDPARLLAAALSKTD
jgi:hypothetical protein